MALRVIGCVWRVALFTLVLASVSLRAQDKPNSPDPQIPPDPKVTADAEMQPDEPDLKAPPDPKIEPNPQDKEARDEVPKRIFWIIPNFMTANDQPENAGPLTPNQKYNIAWHQFWDMSAHFGNVIQAAISQAANSIPHYGQGWGPFGERVAAQEGDQFTGSMLIYGVLPNMLHQDPRYFRRGRGSAWKRIVYATSRVLIARTDAGKPTFNASQVFGQLGQASLSMIYYPKQDREIDGVLEGWAINQGYNIGWNQLKEFTPDLGAFMRRHSKKYKEAQVKDSRSPLQAND